MRRVDGVFDGRYHHQALSSDSINLRDRLFLCSGWVMGKEGESLGHYIIAGCLGKILVMSIIFADLIRMEGRVRG